MKKYLLILIVLSTLALWPFFKSGYFESHDGEWMVIRFTAFHQTLSSGQFPVRFVDRLNNNYGYPVFNFLYPLPFYLSEIPKLAGFGFVESIKVTFVLSTIASVLAMFWALSQTFSKTSSLAGAIVYLFVPYRFVDLYVRGSLGESVAFAFVPLILGSIAKIQKGEKKYLPILSLSISALILSHNVIALLFMPFFVVFASLLMGKGVLQLVVPFVLGILISAFFTFSALFDLQYVRLSQIKVSEIGNHLVDISKLIIPTWGYGPNPNSAGGLSVQFGIVTLLVIFASSYRMVTTKKHFKIVTFLLFCALAIFILNTKFSSALWGIIPGADIIQFSWRLHAIVTFIAAFMAAYILDSSKKKILFSTLLISAAVFSTIAYTKPTAFTDKGDGYYSTNEDTTNVRDEYLPLWVLAKPTTRANEKIVVDTNIAVIKSQTIKPANYQTQLTLAQPSKITINTIYFPGWQVKSDGQKVPISVDNRYGLINFALPQGEHEVIIKYTNEGIHLKSEVVSTVALLITGAYFFKLWRKQNFS